MMYAWVAQYKGADWGSIVIETTPAKAKARFHETFKNGDLAAVRLSDQRRADGFTPGVINSRDDPRLKRLGFSFKKKEGNKA
jgi:hypothetical protein